MARGDGISADRHPSRDLRAPAVRGRSLLQRARPLAKAPRSHDCGTGGLLGGLSRCHGWRHGSREPRTRCAPRGSTDPERGRDTVDSRSRFSEVPAYTSPRSVRMSEAMAFDHDYVRVTANTR